MRMQNKSDFAEHDGGSAQHTDAFDPDDTVWRSRVVNGLRAAALALITFGVTGCGPISPYLLLQDVDLSRNRVFVSAPVQLDSEHWVCAVFSPWAFQNLTPADLAELSKASYRIEPAGAVALYPFDEEARASNDLPANVEYLFQTSGSAVVRIVVDFSKVNLRVNKFRIGTIKNHQDLKDFRIRWDMEALSTPKN
jgi:hypothetical protein